MTGTDTTVSGTTPIVAGSLTGIHVYPVKSCRGIALDRVEVTSRGPAGDRMFQVIDADARPITQRQAPRLATVQPTLVDGGLRLEADGASVLVVNSASLEWLNDRADEPFGMDRFRPNFTVDAGAWVEDTWRDLSVGPARLGVGLAWPRCAIPQIDQVDGSRHRQPARVLKAHRWCSDASSAHPTLRPILEGNALFGIACSVSQPSATVTIGDDVIVHRTGPRIIDAPHDA